MFSIIKYTWIRLIRNKTNLFWVLLFPIALGGLFQAAFSNLSSLEEFSPIPTAVVCSGDESSPLLTAAAANPLLSVYRCSSEEALAMLEEQQVDGILTIGDSITLTVDPNRSSARLNQSILQVFTEQCSINAALIKEAPAAAPALAADADFRKEVCYGRRWQDPYTQYFYNLMAMACMFTALSGIYISLENQGNLTVLGARKNCASTNKLFCIIGELIAYIGFEVLLNIIAFLFLIFVYGVDMRARLPLSLLTILISSAAGVSMGFFIGSASRRSESIKIGSVTAITLLCCFFSGLMQGNMRMVVEQHAPFFNRINPAALIADSFYCLNMLESLRRYTVNILTLVLLSVLFCLGGFLLTRRKRYADL